MSNRSGCKHTALGWIPEDWGTVHLKDLVDPKRTIRYGIVQPGNYSSTGRYMVRGQDYSFGWVKPENLFRVSDEIEIKYKNARLKAGDLIITIVGAGTGTVEIVPEWLDGANLTQTTARIAIQKGKACPNFCFQFLKSHLGQKLTYQNIKGGAQPGLNCGDIENYLLPAPVLKEQCKIGAILSTWDEAITKTQQLIAKLQHRNKGLIQQLLTGKKRLNGFEHEEWKKLHANEIFKSVTVKNKPGEQLLSATQDKGIIPRSMLEARVTMPSGETASFKLVEKGDFVISLRSFQGGIEYSEYRGLVSPAYTVLKPAREINNSYYKHYFKSYNFIGHLAVAVIGIRDGKQVSYEDFSFLKLPYPSVQEQKAIAKVLDAAVNEVKLYEQRLAALQQQKKGLMQKLLTGETRVKIEE